MTEDDLEGRTHDALRRLPTPRAPQTLLPRVIGAVRGEPRRAWYVSAWRVWPHGWQAVSALAVFVAIVTAAVLLGPVDDAIGRELMARLGDWPSRVSTTAGRIATAFNATVLVWRTIVEPVRVYVIAFVAITSMACALLGAVLVHAATERMSRT